jgi:hypothetical protein
MNVEHTGILHVRKDPINPNDERQWVVVWMGDGKKTSKWRENRGGYREGSGRPKGNLEIIKNG